MLAEFLPPRTACHRGRDMVTLSSDVAVQARPHGVRGVSSLEPMSPQALVYLFGKRVLCSDSQDKAGVVGAGQCTVVLAG